MTEATTLMMTEKVAVYLAERFMDMQESIRPIDRKNARFLFEGASEVVSALGWGTTPTSVWVTVSQCCSWAGKRPAASTTARKAWQRDVTRLILMNKPI